MRYRLAFVLAFAGCNSGGMTSASDGSGSTMPTGPDPSAGYDCERNPAR